MSSLKLHYEDDGLSEGVTGQYSDRKAFDILQGFLQPDGDLSVEEAGMMISHILLSWRRTGHVWGLSP